MSFSFSNLITDRTIEDAQRVKELAAKGWDGMTAAERAEWEFGYAVPCCDADGAALIDSDGMIVSAREGVQRGSYKAADMNRVGAAVESIAAAFAAQGYTVEICSKTDYVPWDTPTSDDFAIYLANVAALRGQIAMKPTTPPLPSTIEGLSTDGANAIEQVLKDLDELLTHAARGWYYSGELYAAEV